MEIKLLTCKQYKTYRSYNQCGCKTLLIGESFQWDKDDGISCVECSGSIEYDVSSILGLNALTEIIEKI